MVKPGEVLYLSMNEKRYLFFHLNKLLICSKRINIANIIIYFVTLGILGWTAFFSIASNGDDRPIDFYTYILKIFLLSVACFFLCSQYKLSHLIIAIVFQLYIFACLNGIVTFLCIFPIMIIFMCLVLIRNIPLYQALEKEEGYPYFLENKR